MSLRLRNPRSAMLARAREVFFDKRVYRTAGGTGLLVYVSLYERMAAVIADQKVLEPERPARRIVAIGHEQAFADQRLRCHAHFAVQRQELIECEVFTDHAGSLERDLFRRRQPVEPRRDDRLNGFRER